MTRILLMDDSLTIQKVVKLTFANLPDYEVRIAKNVREAKECLTGPERPHVVVGYVRFAGEAGVPFYSDVRQFCPGVLILTESSENLDPLEKAGFRHFLRKPFHSEELRQAVQTLSSTLANTVESPVTEFPLNGAEEQTRSTSASTETEEALLFPQQSASRNASVAQAGTPPPPRPAAFRTTVKSAPVEAAPVPPPPTPSKPPMPPTPAPPSKAPPSVAPPAPQARAVPNPPPGPTQGASIPQLTMDVESLERSYRETLSQRSRPVATKEPRPAPVESMEDSLDFGMVAAAVEARVVVPVTSSPPQTPQSQEPPQASPFTTAGFPGLERHSYAARAAAPEIELAGDPNEAMVLEDVHVNTRLPDPRRQASPTRDERGHGVDPRPLPEPASLPPTRWKEDIDAAVDDALMRALQRAVPAKIEEKLETAWAPLVAEISTRLKDELGHDLQRWRQEQWTRAREELATELRQLVSHDLRAQLEQALPREMRTVLESVLPREMKSHLEAWLARESLGVAKDVVRDEIHKLLEGA